MKTFMICGMLAVASMSMCSIAVEGDEPIGAGGVPADGDAVEVESTEPPAGTPLTDDELAANGVNDSEDADEADEDDEDGDEDDLDEDAADEAEREHADDGEDD